MELLQSDKFKLPTLYFISDREEIRDIPIGVPFIYGSEEQKSYIIRILEYEILYQEAIKSGYPFDFKKILKNNGYEPINLSHGNSVYMDYKTEGVVGEEVYITRDTKDLSKNPDLFKKFVRDSSAYVDIQKLKDLNIFPIWLDEIEKAVHTNIHNFAVFNNNMYNKKLEGMYGGIDLVAPPKNLIIIDISGSIPRAVSTTCLILAKNLAETFYADLLITGSKSTLYNYENLLDLDVESIYEENGMDNDQVYFRKLVTSDERHYKTAIVFGDNHSPCDRWSNKYNRDIKRISRSDGRNLCKWTVDKLLSFHTTSNSYTAGYADWFTPEETTNIKDWVKYLDN